MTAGGAGASEFGRSPSRMYFCSLVRQGNMANSGRISHQTYSVAPDPGMQANGADLGKHEGVYGGEKTHVLVGLGKEAAGWQTRMCFGLCRASLEFMQNLL